MGTYNTTELLIIIIGMSLVTMVPRLVPALMLSHLELPRTIKLWLKYVPTAVLSAILIPEILIRNQSFDVSFQNGHFWVSLPVFLIALKTKNIFTTVISGFILMALWNLI